MKQFLSVNDVPDVDALVKEGLTLKKSPFTHQNLGKNKTIGMIFFNPSLRTRLSTQKAALNLGMSVMVMNINQEGWQIEFEDGAVMNGDKQEHIKEAVAVVSQYCDILGVRTFASLTNREKDYQEEVLQKFIQYSSVPVISLESATKHPLQSLADLLMIEEHKKIARPKVVLTWAPHPRALPQAVPNSFVEWMKEANVDLTVAFPEGYELEASLLAGVKTTHQQNEAFENADFIYAKNWSSYREYGKILSNDPTWTVDQRKMDLTNGARFMHCLPIRRNVIATDEVIDNSAVIELAGNRVFAAQAVLKRMIER